MNLSMNEAATHLKIGKTRLYQIVNEHKIEPTRRGRRRELSSEQLDNLKNIINFREPESLQALIISSLFGIVSKPITKLL